MRASRRTPRNHPEATPRNRFDAATIHACDTYSRLADRLSSPKLLGREGMERLTKIRAHLTSPSPADWDRLAEAGERAGVIAYHESVVERLKGLPVPDLEVALGTFARESGEFIESRLAASVDPAKIPAAIDEGLDVLSAGGALVRGSMRESYERTAQRALVRDRLGLRGA